MLMKFYLSRPSVLSSFVRGGPVAEKTRQESDQMWDRGLNPPCVKTLKIFFTRMTFSPQLEIERRR